MKQVLFRVAAFAIFFVVGLGIAEIVLRLTPATSSRYPRPEPLVFRSAPENGPWFNGRTYADDPASFRVLVVGDSFTWGGGVQSEDAYPDRLQARLERSGLELERPIEIINWSRPGWNTVQELFWLRRLRPELDADLLIVGLCLNDPEPSDRPERLGQRFGLTRREPAGPIARRLYGWSLLYALVHDRLENQRQRRAFTDYYRSLYEPSPDWRAFVGALKGFRSLANRHEIPLLLVIFPIFDSPLDRYPYGEMHVNLAQVAEQLSIPVLDLLPAYEGVDAGRLAVEPFIDPHPSELAHRIAADRILLYLLEHRLLPATRPRPTESPAT